MAASIESRVPFLDHKLVEFAAALPARMKLRGFKTKWILREAVREILPRRSSRARRWASRFRSRMDEGEWSDVARDVLLDSRSRERGLSRPPAVERLITAHASGEAEGSDALWSLLNLELWYRTRIDGDGVQTLPGKP